MTSHLQSDSQTSPVKSKMKEQCVRALRHQARSPLQASVVGRVNCNQAKQLTAPDHVLVLSYISGIIRVATANLDREARQRYTVVVQAKDMAGSVGGLSGSTTVTVTLSDVNDQPPRFSQSEWSLCWMNHSCDYHETPTAPFRGAGVQLVALATSVSPPSPVCPTGTAGSYQLYLPEVAPVGAEVGRVTATDQDEGRNADVTYSITNAEAASMFSITTDDEQREGIISLKQVRVTGQEVT